MLLKNRLGSRPPAPELVPLVRPAFVAVVVVPVPGSIFPAIGVEGAVTGTKPVEGDRAVPNVGPGAAGEPPVALAMLRVYCKMKLCDCGSSKPRAIACTSLASRM